MFDTYSCRQCGEIKITVSESINDVSLCQECSELNLLELNKIMLSALNAALPLLKTYTSELWRDVTKLVENAIGDSRGEPCD
jgi:DNA integrity scanning protein DisA with diadenylate cyclase activity